jgi:membrane protein
MRAVRVIGRSFVDFFRDNGLMLAGSMSYFTMMALVPFCLFLITVIGYLLGQYPEFYRFFLGKLTNMFPAVTQEITDDLAKIISYKGLGKFSLILYGLLSFQVFASMETALNTVFKVKKGRHFIVSVLVSIAAVTLLVAILTASFAAASIIPVLKTMGNDLTGLKFGYAARFLLRFVVPFFLVLSSVMLVYVLVPKTRVSMSSAFKGALFTTVFLEIAKNLFTWYVGSVVQFGKIYGPLTAFVMFLLWMFYSSCIFLVGAEIVHNLGNRRTAKGEV